MRLSQHSGHTQRRRLAMALLGGSGLTATALLTGRLAAATQDADGALHLICPATVGGSIDRGARIVADGLAQRLQQSIVIENRPGAGTTLGTQLAAQAPPDGRTLLVTASPVFSIGPTLYTSAHYDPQRSFTPIGSFGRSAPYLVVGAGSASHSVADLVAQARRQPGQLRMAHFGTGGASHLPAEQFRRNSGLDLMYVPYKSEADSYADVVAGRVDAAFYYGPLTLPQVQAGRLRALAHADNHRSAALPQVPTLAESGHPGAEFHIEWLLLGPAGLAQARVERLSKALLATLQDAAVQATLARSGIEAASGGPVQAAALIERERIAKGLLLRQLGIQRS